MDFMDVHCHLHDPRVAPCLEPIIRQAQKAGVRYMASCATRQENFDQTLILGRRYSSILPCIGVHPWFVDTISPGWDQDLAQKVLDYPCGIGETGLDFMNTHFNQERQIQVFVFHIHLANDLKRPIIIHMRKAWNTLIHILKKTGPLQVPGILHSYSGSADLVRQLLSYNLYFSFSGAITRKHARKAVHAIQSVPRDRILVETDAPDLLPDIRGLESNGFFYENRLVNQPCYLPAIARAAAGYCSMSCEDFAGQVYENSRVVLDPILV